MTPGSPQLQHRLLKADAGTGKTYNLTVQFLKLLAAGTEPKRVLATTFTRKAAGEILQRILMRVAAASLNATEALELSSDLGRGGQREAARDQEHYRKWLGELVDDLPQLSVGTLDAFFRRLVSGFRYELGLVRMQQIVALNDPLVENLRERAVRSTLDRLAGGEEPLSALTMRLYRGQAQRSVTWAVDRVFLELYEVYRESPDLRVWSQIEVPQGLLGEERFVDALSAFWSEWRDEFETNRSAAELRLGKRVIKGLRQSDALLEERDWKSLLESGLGEKVDRALLAGEESCQYYSKALPAVLFARYVPLIRHARAALLSDLHEQTVATHRLLQCFHEEFSRLRRREGVVLFSDLADLIARELPALEGDHEQALAYRLDGQIEHVLLDEFQDTSTVQWSALRLLVDEVLAYGDGSRTLFCVGDPKQSIYGWRGGRPELFGVVEGQLAEMVESGAALVEPLDLSYRTSPVVLDAVNRVFASVEGNQFLKETTADNGTKRKAALVWAEDFEPHRAAAPRLGDAGYVVLRTSLSWEGMFDADDEVELDSEGTLSEEQPLGHLGYAAERIQEIVERRGGASIGVLTRSNRVVSETLFALRRLGVVASGEGQGRIVDDPAVTAVISAFRLAASPSDTASLVHCAGSSLGELLAVAPKLRQLPQAEAELQAAARSVSLKVRDQILQDGACAVLAGWCRMLAPTLSARSRARVQQLLEVLIDQQEMLDRRPRELVRFLTQVTVTEPAPAAVRVMTVHQAKGLEFDVVVLCELETQLGALYGPLVETLRDTAIASPTAVFRASNRPTRRSDSQLRAAHAQEIERRMRDDLGAAYVALTRARSELHMIVQPVSAAPGKRKPIENFALAGFLRGALSDAESMASKGVGNTVLFEVGQPIEGEIESGRLTDQDDGRPKPVRSAVVAERNGHRSTERSAELSAESPGQSVGESPGASGAASRVAQSRVSPSQFGVHRHANDPLDSDRLDSLLQEQSLGVLRGRILHAYLAEIEWLPKREAVLEQAVLDRVNRKIAPGQDVAWLERIRSDFERMMRTDDIREVLRKPEAVKARCWRERAFTLIDDGRSDDSTLVRGVLDRVLLVENTAGVVTSAQIVDWKTGAVSGRLDDYRAQLNSYRKAVAAMTGLMETAVTAAIVWLDRGVVEPV